MCITHKAPEPRGRNKFEAWIRLLWEFVDFEYAMCAVVSLGSFREEQSAFKLQICFYRAVRMPYGHNRRGQMIQGAQNWLTSEHGGVQQADVDLGDSWTNGF